MRFLLLLSLCFLVGCNIHQSPHGNIPPNSKNIQSLGDGWYTFELNVQGKDRKFMFRRTGSGNTSTETITELH